MRNKVFLDTDVILDFLIDREPFSREAANIFDLADSKRIDAHTSVLCIHNVHYFVRKVLGAKKALGVIGGLLEILATESTEKDDIISALKSGLSDFEDAVQNSTAERIGAKKIITRNTKDYKRSTLLILTPAEFLKSLSVA